MRSLLLFLEVILIAFRSCLQKGMLFFEQASATLNSSRLSKGHTAFLRRISQGGCWQLSQYKLCYHNTSFFCFSGSSRFAHQLRSVSQLRMSAGKVRISLFFHKGLDLMLHWLSWCERLGRGGGVRKGWKFHSLLTLCGNKGLFVSTPCSALCSKDEQGSFE